MPTFPQLSTGAMTQFPFRAEVRFRSVRHEGPSGGEFSSADLDFEERYWDISLEDLTDVEWSALEQLFQESGGPLRGFTFLDPSANLLAWSEVLDEDAWSNSGAGLTLGIADPLGGAAATKLTAGGGGDLVSQTVAAPAGYRYAGSVWARTSGLGGSIRVTDGQGLQAVETFQSDGVWRRYSVAYPGGGSGDSVRLELSLAAGASVDIFGPQIDAQAAASEYKPSGGRSGVHPNARFDQEVLSDRSPGPNRHSTRLRILWTPSLA